MTLQSIAPPKSNASRPIGDLSPSGPTQASPPKRRWYQFSLRSLLAVLTLFVFLLAGYWAVFRTYVEPYRVQREAAEKLQEKWPELEIVWEPAGPRWMRDVFGEEHFRDVVKVQWPWPGPYKAITANDLARLECFGNLRDLDITAEEISKSGLAHLPQLTRLENLSIASPQITDQDLVHLQDLTQLRSLSLEYTSITGEGLAYLTKLKNLKKLSLVGSKLNDESSHHLSQFAGLEDLDVWRTQITDKSLRHLGELANLKQLNLMDTRVTHGGCLTSLQKLACLETLVVDDLYWKYKNADSDLKKLETLLPKLEIIPIQPSGY